MSIPVPKFPVRVPFAAFVRGWAFLKTHQMRFFQAAALPAVLWFLLKSLPFDPTLTLPSSNTLANVVVGLFALSWFRFVVGGGQGREPQARRFAVPRGAVIGRFLARTCVIVVGVSVVLVIPTVMIALLLIYGGGAEAQNPEAVIRDAVSRAFPLAILLLSPLLVRLYAYYGALAAGRHDVSFRDAWQWMRGRSLGLLLLIGTVLAPAAFGLNLVEKLGLGAFGYGLAMPILFVSVALAATASARAMGGLIAVPVMSVRG